MGALLLTSRIMEPGRWKRGDRTICDDFFSIFFSIGEECVWKMSFVKNHALRPDHARPRILMAYVIGRFRQIIRTVIIFQP